MFAFSKSESQQHRSPGKRNRKRRDNRTKPGSSVELKLADALRTEAQYQEDAGNYREAERILNESVLLRSASLGETHVEVAEDFYNLGLLNLALDNNSRAEILLLRSLLIRRLQFDADHPDVQETVNMLALLHEEPAEGGELQIL